MILAVCAWFALDVGRGVFHGIADARQKELDATPISKIVKTTEQRFRDRLGADWTEHAAIQSVSSNLSEITFTISLTPEAKSSIEPRWAKGRIVGMRHDIREEACGERSLRYILSRGGRIRFQDASGPVKNLLPTHVPADYC